MSTRDEVRSYVTRILSANKDDRAPFSDSDSLVVSGRLTSLDVVDLVVFLEGKFNFAMEPSEFDLSKFDSVDSIVALVE